MESKEQFFMIGSSFDRDRGNRAINAAVDENYGEILKSGDNTLLRYKVFDGDGEILRLEGLPCEAVIKKEDKVVYRTPAEVDAENVVSFKITEVLPSDRSNPYTIEFIITQGQDTLIFPSDDRINLFIYPSSLSVDSDIIEQTPESRLNEIVIVAFNDAAQEIYLELINIRDTLSALDPNDTSGELQRIKDDIARIETDLANITPGNYDQEIQQINDELTTINSALSTYETPSGAQEKANTAETNAKAYADNILTGAGGGVSSWNDLMDKPSTFTPSEHTHTMTEVNGLQDALDGLETPSGAQAKADAAEQNAKSYADSVAVGGDAGPVTWETVQDKPDFYPAGAHNHSISEVTGLQTKIDGLEQSDTEITAQLAQTEQELDLKKLDKNSGAVTSADLSQEVKEQMTGGSVAVVGKNTVLTENIVDKAVTPEKTDFLISSGYNGIEMFDLNNVISNAFIVDEPGIPNRIEIVVNQSNFKSVYMPISKNTPYRIKKLSPTNRFRVALLKSPLDLTYSNKVYLTDDQIITTDDNLMEVEFFNSEYSFLVVFYSTLNEITDFSITENAETFTFSNNIIMKEENIDSIDRTDIQKIKSSGFPFPNDLIAFWDFGESEAPYYSKAGVDKFPLKIGETAPKKTTMKPFGTGLKFNGSTDYLVIPSDETGALNVAKSGDEVTVVAWIKRPQGTTDKNAFIAGMWQEDDNDPKRQYGMFTHLPMYGGGNRVCGHVSRTGGASPNLPFSRDYSTSARMLGKDIVRNIAMVYDGDYVTSYIDGYADSRTNYKEPNSPNGEGLTYDKNPYEFDLGLNRFSVSDFTVGSVRLTNGMGNHFNAELGGLAVFRRALTSEEIMKIHLDSLSFGDPIQTYDFHCNANDVPLGDYGWFVTGGDTVQDYTKTVGSWTMANSQGNYFTSLATQSGLNIFETNEFNNIRMTQLNKVSLKMNGTNSLNSIKFCIKLNDKWYATSEDYHDKDGGVVSNWTGALTHNIPISREPSNWLELNYNKGTQLSLGTIATEKLPNGEIQSWGILANEMVSDSRIRLTDIKFYSN